MNESNNTNNTYTIFKGSYKNHYPTPVSVFSTSSSAAASNYYCPSPPDDVRPSCQSRSPLSTNGNELPQMTSSVRRSLDSMLGARYEDCIKQEATLSRAQKVAIIVKMCKDMKMEDDDIMRSLFIGLGCTMDTISVILDEVNQTTASASRIPSGPGVSLRSRNPSSQLTNSPIASLMTIAFQKLMQQNSLSNSNSQSDNNAKCRQFLNMNHSHQGVPVHEQLQTEFTFNDRNNHEMASKSSHKSLQRGMTNISNTSNVYNTYNTYNTHHNNHQQDNSPINNNMQARPPCFSDDGAVVKYKSLRMSFCGCHCFSKPYRISKPT